MRPPARWGSSPDPLTGLRGRLAAGRKGKREWRGHEGSRKGTEGRRKEGMEGGREGVGVVLLWGH